MKFTPEKIIDRITVSENGGELRAVYPHFIASKYDLELTVTKISGRYYVHENGCVVRYLEESGIYPLYEKNRKKLESVFGVVLAGEKLQRGYTREDKGYFDFIKNLIFILNLDLILPYLDTEERYSADDCTTPNVGIPYEDVSGYGACVQLKVYEKDDGYLISSGIRYSDSDVGASTVFFKECADGTVYIDDGETHFDFRRNVLELLEHTDNGFEIFAELTSKICERFGIELHDKRISMVSKPNTEVLLNNFFRFVQGAVLLSEIGYSGMLHTKNK